MTRADFSHVAIFAAYIGPVIAEHEAVQRRPTVHRAPLPADVIVAFMARV